MKFVETELDSLLVVMTETLTMEMDAQVLAQFNQDTLALEDLRTPKILAVI
jgi:hypothetical protein